MLSIVTKSSSEPMQSAAKPIHMYEPSQEWHDFTFDWLMRWRKNFLIHHKASIVWCCVSRNWVKK